MAAFFYDSTGSNTAPYDTWAKAATSLATVAAAMAAGDTLWVGDDSNESVAGVITATFPGTAAAPNFIYCVDHTKASPATGDLKTGAAGAGSVTTTGNNAITLNGSFYCYGVAFISGSGVNTVNLNLANTGGNSQKFENCILKIGGTSGGTIALGTGSAVSWTMLLNCTLTVSAAGSLVRNSGKVVVSGGSITGTPTTTLFAGGGTVGGFATYEGFDYSNLGNRTLFSNQSAGENFTLMKDCKAPATYTRQTTLTVAGIVENCIIRADSSATAYIQEKYNYWGSQVAETSIVRSGGATDGTTAISWAVTPLNTSWVEPFVCFPISIWNSTIGAVNVTVHATSNLAAGAFPNTDEIWIEVEGPGTSGNPKGIYATNTKANNLATGSAYSSSGASWGGSPAGGVFSMTAAITTTQVGPLTVYVKAAKTSTIFYVDPKVTLS